jgi:hypothetical protein
MEMPDEEGHANGIGSVSDVTKPSGLEMVQPNSMDQRRMGSGIIAGVKRRHAELSQQLGPSHPVRTTVYRVLSTVVLVILLAVFFVLVEGLSSLWRPLGIVLYLIPLLIATAAIGGFYFRLAKGDTSSSKALLNTRVLSLLYSSSEEISEFFLSYVFLLACAVIISFSQLCRHLFLFFQGFETHQTGYWQWLTFGISQALDNALYGVFSAYNIGLSQIQATAWWSHTLLFLFNLSLTLLVIAAILGQFHIVWQNRHEHSS